ncbi:hypothetical protein ScPMuIL_004148 [Solemya velum]
MAFHGSRFCGVFDDWVNRLNNFWTFYLLLLLSAMAGWQKYQSEYISCWFPAHFTSAMVNYGHKVCWDSKTYFFPQDEPSTLSFPHTKVSFYQWIPLLLVFQALLFKLPHVIWLMCHGYSGVNMSKIQRLGQGTPASTWAEHRMTAAMVARYLDSWLQSDALSCLPWRVLSILAGVVKLLYVTNAFTQFSVIDSFLLQGGNKSNFGYYYINMLMDNETTEWPGSPWFPHMILCDYEIRQLDRIERYTSQCLLPINEFYEQVYCFVSVWLLFVAIVTTFSLAVGIVKSVLPFFRTRYVKKLLMMSPDIDGQRLGDNEISTFAGGYLGEDGVMVLKMIGENSSELMVSDVVVQMWRRKNSSHPAVLAPSAPLYQPTQVPGPPPLVGHHPLNQYTPQQPHSGHHLYPQTVTVRAGPETVPLVPVQGLSGTKFE